MTADDEAARRARADRLKRQIAEKTAPGKPADKPPRDESPREFVERKRRDVGPTSPRKP